MYFGNINKLRRIIQMKKTLALILAGVMALGLTACGGSTLNMATGGTSGTYYGFSSVVANVLNEKVETLNVTVESTGASAANIDLIDTGADQLAIVQNDVMYYAYNATDMYEGKTPWKAIPLSCPATPSTCRSLPTRASLPLTS